MCILCARLDGNGVDSVFNQKLMVPCRQRPLQHVNVGVIIGCVEETQSVHMRVFVCAGVCKAVQRHVWMCADVCFGCACVCSTDLYPHDASSNVSR